MQVKHCLIGSLMLVVLVCGSGCEKTIESIVYPSLLDAKIMAQRELTAIKEQTATLSAEHKVQTPKVADKIDAIQKAFDIKIDKLRKDAADQKGTVSGLVGTLAGFAGIPGSGAIKKQFEGAAEDATDAKKDRAGIRTTAATLAITTATLGTELGAVQDALAKLDPALIAKLELVTDRTMQDLEGLKDDDKAFRAKLQADLQLSNAEMEALKGFSTQEILALLAAAGTAAAAGGTLAKTGKSRSHGDIEKIKDRLDAITTDIALTKPSSVADTLAAHAAKPA